VLAICLVIPGLAPSGAPRNDEGAVNNGENPNCLRILRRSPISMVGWHDSRPKSPMRFTPQFLEELRARLPVSEVVGRRVKLKKAGREWKGLSPFQQEKSPSFTVNDQKGIYHDFSSGKHGDIISFLMETEVVGFNESIERL